MWDILTSLIIISFLDVFFPKRKGNEQNNGLSDYALLGGMENGKDDLSIHSIHSNEPFLNDNANFDCDGNFDCDSDYDF